MFDGIDQEQDLVKAGGNAATTSMRVRDLDEERSVFPVRRKIQQAERPTSSNQLEVFEMDKRHSNSSSSIRHDEFLAI